MSQPLFVVGTFTCKPGQAQAVRDILTKAHSATHSKEPERQTMYEMLNDAKDENKFALVERWVSLEAIQKHQEEPHFKETMEKLTPMLEGGLSIGQYHSFT